MLIMHSIILYFVVIFAAIECKCSLNKTGDGKLEALEHYVYLFVNDHYEIRKNMIVSLLNITIQNFIKTNINRTHTFVHIS